MRAVYSVAAVLLVALAVAGTVACGRRAGTSAAGEDWRADLTWTPPHLVALRPTVLRLRLSDGRGRPLDIENLQVSAGMPEMGHEEFRVEFRRTGPGAYEAHHTFSMDGEWIIALRGRRGGAPYEARLRVAIGN